MASPQSNSGSITTAEESSVELNNILGLNTASVLIQGTWSGNLAFQAKIDDSPWFGIPMTDAYALDGQAPVDATASSVFKVPVSGYTDFRVHGQTATGTADIWMGAVEGAEVMQEVLAYTFVTPASDAVFKTQEQV